MKRLVQSPLFQPLPKQVSALSVFGVIASWFLSFSACGPSVQSIYEGNVRFEHCYRLDLELDVATSHRQACWSSWLSQYTYGQPRDRLDYARKRVRSFAIGEGSGRPLRVAGAKGEEKRQFYLVVPTVTNAHSSPPPIATRTHAATAQPPDADAGAAEDLAEATASPAPGESCATECRSAFSSCGRACEPTSKSAACASCDPDYKKCMQRCFE